MLILETKSLPATPRRSALSLVLFWIETLGWFAWDVAGGRVTPPQDSEEHAMKLARLRRWAA